MIEGVIITNLKIIQAEEGRVLHGIKKSDDGFKKFGEAYFSSIYKDQIKAWKRHKEMSLNIIVPSGKIKFVLYDDRKNSATTDKFQEIILSDKNYKRLTVPPKVWVGFMGLSKNESFLLNVADLEHNAIEVDRLDIFKINFNWKV